MKVPSVDTKQLFDFVNSITDSISTAENVYKDFLRWSGLFINDQGDGVHYSIANQLLIYGYDNNARLVREESEWNRMGATVIKPDQAIHVLKRQGEGYTDRVVYDISATNSQPLQMIDGRDWGSKCEAMTTASPCRLEYDPLTANQRTNFIHKENVIKVGKGFQSYENIFASLSQEYAHYYISREMEKRHERKFRDVQKNAANEVGFRDAYYKFFEGKYYELPPDAPIMQDSTGRLFIVEKNDKGMQYKVHVEKRQTKVNPGEVRVPDFTYSKAAYHYLTYAVSFCVCVKVGIDPDKFHFTYEKWKDKSFMEIREDLDIITATANKILYDYHNQLIKQQNAVFTDTSYIESEVD